MARDGVLPPILGRVAANGTPRQSVVFLVAASLAFAATGTYESLVRIYSPWSMGAIIIVCLSAIKLRISEPDLPRPWKMPLFPWIAIGAVLVQGSLIAVLAWDDPVAGLWSTVVAVAPLPLYFIFAKTWRRQAQAIAGIAPAP